MAKAHVKKGDEVVVIAGSELGKRGKILSVNLKKQRVLIEGIKMIKRHTAKNQQNPQGAIVEREGTIHISNVTLAAKFDDREGAETAAPETAQA
ncbi:MAG TPA: 50S ribosomal protein L24 [Candidatus Baltobacteraceae bacterium]|jgi:large subunit ribosomal protein L24|nr:50S ribosomal protein L24 [Candidatus Baltobacteraceae bacterium]